MLAAIAFCPQPPLLVPLLATGAARELDALRLACWEALRRLRAADPDRIVVVGEGPGTSTYPAGSAGTLAGFGYPLVASLGGSGEPPWTLPPALTIGAWLLTGADGIGSGVAGCGVAGCGVAGTGAAGTGATGPAAGPGAVGAGAVAAGLAVRPDANPAEVAASLAGADRLGLLVMGDGSARRCERAPGYIDPRAEPFDAAVAAALGTGDAGALRDLDPALGADLLAAGVPAWRVAGHLAADAAVEAELLHDAAPYGVGYLVASWVAR